MDIFCPIKNSSCISTDDQRKGSSIALTIDLAPFFFFPESCEFVKVFNLQNEALHKQYCFLNSKLR